MTNQNRATESHGEVQAEKGREKAKSPSSALRADGSPGPDLVCWEHQANREPIRLSFSIKVF